MSGAFFHEKLYRNDLLMKKISDFGITICGAGALGANVAESLARSGFAKLKVIDRDRIEERNLSTQPYYRSDIGAFKAKVLANSLYRAIGVTIEPRTEELTASNVRKLLVGSSLVIDLFDNSLSRNLVKEFCSNANVSCLHAGLSNDYAEVIWNENYRVPSPANDDICEYALARNLVTLTTSIICEVVVAFVALSTKSSFTVTLKDFAVRRFTEIEPV